MIKRICSIMLALAIAICLLPIANVAAETKTAVAVYGTPVIDGEIDEIWNETNYYITQYCVEAENAYKGWFKMLWDENQLYMLARVYSTQLDNSNAAEWWHDSVDMYIDENMKRTVGFENFDYQVRTNFKALVSGNNYDDLNKITSSAKELDNGFLAEWAIPLKSGRKLSEGMSLGFEVLMTASETLSVERRQYTWNCEKDWLYNDTSKYGTLTLKKSNTVEEFKEPEWVEPKSIKRFRPSVNAQDEVATELIEDVTVTFDDKPYTKTIMHVNEYPSMDIADLAEVIGGRVENGDTLVKDDVRIMFTPGRRLAVYGNGHIMLERVPVVYNSKMYVPVSATLPTMLYTMRYNRFDKTLSIRSGCDYPEPEVIVYAKDYGAVGDGVHYDGGAIQKAINAAVNSGKPSKVMLEPNKTYLLESRASNKNFFLLEDIDNFTLDGQGSMFLFEKPTNSFMDIRRCANINMLNFEVDYKELPFTQGRALEVNAPEGYFIIEFDEGFPLPAADDWVKHYWTNANHGGWWFTQIMDPVEPRFKYEVNNWNIFLDSITPIEGRKYKVTVKADYKDELADAVAGDRFVINTRYSSYDVGDWTHQAWEHGNVQITESGDITFNNVDIWQSPWHYFNVGFCWGRINLIDCGMLTREGYLMSTNSDGIHCWRNRGGFYLDGCKLMNNLDDHINIRTDSAQVLNRVDEYTYDTGLETYTLPGDEVIFVDIATHTVLGRAYVKSSKKINNSTFRVTVDRKVDNVRSFADGASQPTVLLNVNSASEGTVIRNSTFMYSRRFGCLIKSKNSIYENNYCFENGGSGLAVCDESLGNAIEGAFPSAFSIRNNTIVAPDIISPWYPLQIQAMGIKNGETAEVDGLLIEGNTLDCGKNSTAIMVNSVDGLYMFDNTIKSTAPALKGNEGLHMPILIKNCKVEKIDGITFDYEVDVNAVITVIGSEIDTADITNVDIKNENTAKPYEIME